MERAAALAERAAALPHGRYDERVAVMTRLSP